jgi:pimeloyl-ACP methyl ester carboxylesterase
MQRIAAVRNITHAVIEDAGHMLHHDQPEVLAQLLDEFLRIQKNNLRH